MGDVDTLRTTEVGMNEPFSSEQVLLQKEFHSFKPHLKLLHFVNILFILLF